MTNVLQESGIPPGNCLRVQKDQCKSCIFRADSSLDLKKLLDDVRDFTVPGFLFFKGYRVCHYSEDAVCAGFWQSFKDRFALGQIAQRLGLVKYVQDDNDEGDMSNKSRAKHEARLARQREPKQQRLFTTNIAAQAMRMYRPDEHGGLTEAELQHAVQAANGRLEAKSFPAGGTKPVDPQWAAMRNIRARSKSAPSSRTVVLPPEPVVVIPEPEFLAAMQEASTAGRSTITPAELSRLLALPYPVNYRDQKGFVKERIG